MYLLEMSDVGTAPGGLLYIYVMSEQPTLLVQTKKEQT